jgi:hypothetical protein
MGPDGLGNTMAIIITILIVSILIILAWLSNRKRKKIEVKLEKITSKLNAALKQVEELNEKYSPIIDMELHLQQILNETNEISESNISQSKDVLKKAEAKARELSISSHSKAEKLITDAELESVNIKGESKELNAKANQKLKDINEKVVTLTNEAHEEANRIIELAKVQAQEVAGDAYDAKLKADSYEAAIRAMKNTIEGYKDDYIIPNHSVLDDLAEEFSFKDAGEQLKQARKRVKDMVKQGYAGECDYVEIHRKTYAIHFAVDAFNGKVDSALAKVKHDNFGKIKQEIIDAFALVNYNGAPFRNARINQSFLDARQEELKWAVSTHELRQIELAEQREIKQQIREEEKARKEIEKAIKEAEKEERLIQKP